MTKTLMYHDVFRDNPQESGFNSKSADFYKIDITAFENHLAIIGNKVVYTFDDGGVSFIKLIAPLLNKYKIIGHFFIATDYIGKDGFLNKDDVIELSKTHIIGAHSASHPTNMKSMDVTSRKREWFDSISLLEDLTGREIKEVSIPNGYFQDTDIEYLSELGIKRVYTSSIFENRHMYGVHIVGRLGVNCKTGANQLYKQLNSKYEILKLSIYHYSINCIKFLLGDKYAQIKKYYRNM